MEAINNEYYLDISLRPLTVEDIDEVMVWASDEKVAKFCSWSPITNKEEGINYITQSILPRPWVRAICLAKTPIGYVFVTPNTGADISRAEIGYVLGSKYWGKGIATKTVKMVTKEMFKERAYLERIEAFVDVENFGSQKVLEKAGFVKEGVLRKYFILKGKSRDTMIFSILSTDLVVD